MELSLETVITIFDVPPWIACAFYPVPRFPRLRWRLRRVWPLRPIEDVVPAVQLDIQRAYDREVDRAVWGL